MARRPTKRALVVGGAGFLLVLAGSTAQAGWLFVLAAVVTGLVAGSAFIASRPRSLRIRRIVAARARVGDEVSVRIALDAGSRAVRMGIVEDAFPAFAPVKVAHDAIASGGSVSLEMVRRTERRGVFEDGRVVWSSAAPFGLVRVRRSFDVDSPLVVVPRWVDLRTFPILEPSSYTSDVVHERARTGAGEEYLGVRDYRPGDPPKFVHWRSTARAGRLIVREYEQETSVRVALLLGGGDHIVDRDSSYEALVSAVASVGLYALSTGHPVDVLRIHRGGIEHLASPGRQNLLEWLAAAEPSDGSLEELARRASSRTARRGTVVLFAPTSGEAGASIPAAVRVIQGASARAIAVLARADTWDAAAASTVVPDELGRVGIKRLARGEDLAACLQG